MACIAAKLSKPTEIVATMKCPLNQGSETAFGEINVPGKRLGSREQTKANKIANQRKQIAETHLKMSRLAFESGEIQLIDYLKIQANAQSAIRDALERGILVQRDTAFYNQVVGVVP